MIYLIPASTAVRVADNEYDVILRQRWAKNLKMAAKERAWFRRTGYDILRTESIPTPQGKQGTIHILNNFAGHG